jgi:hypothetical protein
MAGTEKSDILGVTGKADHTGSQEDKRGQRRWSRGRREDNEYHNTSNIGSGIGVNVNNSSGGVNNNNSTEKRRGDKKKNRGQKSRDNANDNSATHPHPNDYISSYLTTGLVPDFNTSNSNANNTNSSSSNRKQTTRRRGSSLGGLKDSTD